MRAIVLCCHSINIHGGDYHANDHVALAQDLRLLSALPATASGLPGGTFANIVDYAAADCEIRQASAFVDARLGAGQTTLIAYPYGESSAWLREDYLPRFVHEHGLQAAFGTEPEPITAASSRWMLGRYVCGHHWRSPEGLQCVAWTCPGTLRAATIAA